MSVSFRVCVGRAGVYVLDYAPLLHRINVTSNQYHRVLRLIKKHLSRVPRSIGVPLKAALGECSSSLRYVSQCVGAVDGACRGCELAAAHGISACPRPSPTPTPTPILARTPLRVGSAPALTLPTPWEVRHVVVL